MNPRDVFNARANFESAAQAGAQRSTEFLKTIEDQLNHHADQLHVPRESSLNSSEEANEKGWIASSYQVYGVAVPVSVRSVGQRLFEVSVDNETPVQIDAANADDLPKVCGLIFNVALHHYDRARARLTS